MREDRISNTAHTLVGLKDAITSLTPVVLGTFEPRVRVMLSEVVPVTEGASSRSIGVEAMLGVPARAGWLNWAGVQWMEELLEVAALRAS